MLGIGTIILIILIVFVVIKICRKCKTSKATSLLHENLTLHFYITVFIKHYNTHLVLLLFVLVFILLSNLFFIWSKILHVNVFSVSCSCTFSDNRNDTDGNRSNTELTLNYNTYQWRPDRIKKDDILADIEGPKPSSHQRVLNIYIYSFRQKLLSKVTYKWEQFKP